HHRGGGGVFVDGLAPGAQRHQEAAHLRRGRVAGEEDGKRRLALGPGQGALDGGGEQGLATAHAGTTARSRKLRSIAWPCSEAMLSGWNCTPSMGKSRCRSPMIIPPSSQAVTSSAGGRLSRSTISE